MRAMVLTRSRHMELQEIPEPTVAPKGMLLRVEAAAICNATDFRSYAAENTADRWPNIPCPVVLGHEFCGRVVAVGRDIEKWQIGDRLVNWGVSHGAYAEYCHVVPDEVATCPVPADLPSHEAAVLEVGMGAIRYLVSPQGGLLLSRGDRVMVAGLGPSGLFYVQYAALCQAGEIWAADHNAPRCDLARSLGATRVFDSVERLADAAEAEGVVMDAILDTTGSDLHASFARLIRAGGLIVPYGSGCNWDALAATLGDRPFRKADGDTEEIRMALPQILRWIESGALRLAPLVSQRIALEETPLYLEALQKRPKKLVKVVIVP